MDVQVTTRGDVSKQAAEAARRKVAALERYVKGPVLGARVVLTQERNPAIELMARAEGEIDLAGRPIRVRVKAHSMDAAVDQLAERLQAQLRRAVERMITRRRVPPTSPPGEWRHGTLPG